MKIALAQMKMERGLEDNFLKSVRLIKDAAAQGAELVCFPELQLSPFFPQYPDQDASTYSLKPGSPYIAGLCDVCRDQRIHAATNLYLEENGRRYDMSLLVDDKGEIVGRQKMVHIAQCAQFYEKSYYTPSEEGFTVFDTRLGRIGIVVCFDRHYPESIRTQALRGAELIVVPTANTTAEPSELFQWEVRVQAFQNSVNVAMVNRVGVEDAMMFSGESVVCDYNGEMIAQAGNTEELLIAEIDLAGATKERLQKPYTSLRRTECYA